MKKIIITSLIACTAFACKKSTSAISEAPIKYYFKIAPISDDGSHNDTTTYKIITVS